MPDVTEIDIIADRNDDCIESWPFLEEDFTGSTFKMQVRAARDTTGTPLLEHSTGTGSFAVGVVTSTVAAHIAAGRLQSGVYRLTNPATGVRYLPTDSLLLSVVSLGINTTAMETFPYPQQRGDDAVFYYDVRRTPASGSPELILRGRFIVRAGSTLP